MAKQLKWRKSPYSDMSGGNCVEIANDERSGLTHVRDSKNPAGPQLAFTPAEWDAFTRGVKNGLL